MSDRNRDHDHPHDHSHGHSHDRRRGWRELLTPHRHSHAAEVDRALETSAHGIRAVKVSLVALLATAVLQAVVVAASGSVALLGDTLHNLADALTALPLWVAFRLARRAPTRRYTYGYGRAEDIAGMFIVVTIALSAAAAGFESTRRLLQPRPIDELGLVAAAAIIGFAGNELVALYRIRVGRAIGSAALIADGLHARTDGLTSLAVLLGALGVALGWPAADPVAGLAITAAIAAILWQAARDVFHRLMDAVDPELVDRAEAAVLAVEGVERIDALRLRWIGHRLRAEVDVTVDSGLTVVQGHDIAVAAHHRLLHDVPRLMSAIVHANPSGDGDHDHHEALEHHRSASGR